ncbi:MAG TPA: hypothetical protein V6C72_12680 [Chroococcales cyanobacterium]
MSSPNSESIFQQFIDDGNRALLKGYLNEAEMLFRAALSLVLKAKASVNSQIGKAMSLLADVYAQRCQYGKAEMFYRNAVAFYDEHDAMGLVDLCVNLKRVSEMCRAQGKTDYELYYNRLAGQLLFSQRDELDELLKRTPTRVIKLF